LFVLATGFAFYIESSSNHGNMSAVTSGNLVSATGDPLSVGTNIHESAETNIGRAINATIDQHAGLLFAAWFVFFILKSFLLLKGLVYVYRVRSLRILDVDAQLQARLHALSERLGISKNVRLLQSGLVKVPVTIGHFKPVILIPIGMILQLPYEQVETILLHELAHIRRKDYLVNLLQSVLETVFFFNPGLLWLSALIREEREICCDDMVLAHTSGKVNYLEALLAFHTYDQQSIDPALALSLRKNQLANRLKRIINQENKRISTMEKIVLLSGMLLVSAFCFVTKTVENQAGRPAGLRYKFSINVGKEEVASPIEPEKVEVKLPEKSLQPVEEVVKDTVMQFKSIRFEHSNQDMSNREMTVRDDKDSVFYFKIVADKLTAVKVNGNEVPDNEITKYQEIFRQADIAWNQARINKQQLIAADRLKSSEERQQHLNAFKQAQKDKNDRKTGHFVKATNAYAGKEKFSINKEKESRVEKDNTNFNKNSNENKPARDVLGVKKMPVPKDMSADQERVRGIIAELVKEKVLADPASIEWFGLSEDELIVNDRKQSAELQQKLKQKYDISTGNGLYYGPVKMTGSGIFLDKDDI
jgi:bla regulator protein BlaR1